MSLLGKIFGSNSSNEDTMPKSIWKPLTERSQLNDIIEESKVKPVAIFKHSTRCSVSRMVLKQFEQEFALKNDITLYFLDLLIYRTLSNEVASLFNVEHQSPQLIVIKNGQAIYHKSHNNIDAHDLKFVQEQN